MAQCKGRRLKVQSRLRDQSSKTPSTSHRKRKLQVSHHYLTKSAYAQRKDNGFILYNFHSHMQLICRVRSHTMLHWTTSNKLKTTSLPTQSLWKTYASLHLIQNPTSCLPVLETNHKFTQQFQQLFTFNLAVHIPQTLIICAYFNCKLTMHIVFSS